ncbi:MAG: hypothetical protein HYX86_04535 [Chloroflexi bacterium]|nr:hypothetical protein [Chloroflexota bacterium]
MTIEDFLRQVVEGYLFHDLANMNQIQLQPPQTDGAAGYPMVITALSGMELLGGILSPNPFNKRNGDDYFRDYWDNYLAKINQGYSGLADLVYQLVRHGLAHTFVAKHGIIVTKGAPSRHMQVDMQNNILIIDATRLYQDLERSYNLHVKPLVFGQNKNQSVRNAMQQRLDEMITDYENDSKRLFSQLKSSQPGSQVPIIPANTGGTIPWP